MDVVLRFCTTSEPGILVKSVMTWVDIMSVVPFYIQVRSLLHSGTFPSTFRYIPFYIQVAAERNLVDCSISTYCSAVIFVA